MASYKARVKELEDALRGIATLCCSHVFPEGHEKNVPVCHDVMKVTDVVLGGGTLAQSGVTVKRQNLMSKEIIDVPLGTPLCCDPSSETYWSM